MDDPIARGKATLMLARGLMISRRADEAVALARRAAADLPPEAGLLRAAFEALELTSPLFGAGEPIAPERFARHRQLPLPPGPGPKLLAAVAVHQWSYSGGSAQECAPLAQAALQGGDLIRFGNVVLSIAAVIVLILADHDEADAAWTRWTPTPARAAGWASRRR